MKKSFLLLSLLFQMIFTYAQDKVFSYLTVFNGEQQLKQIADSLDKPLLIYNNKIYVIGSDCLTRLFDGSLDDRDKDGDSDNRFSDGAGNERNKGGAVADRKKKGKRNNRDKGGSNSDRDDDGDVNDRKMGAGSDNRDTGGSIADGPRCSYAKNGKILLYTRQEIKGSNAQIYYNHQYFSNKHFKIIKL